MQFAVPFLALGKSSHQRILVTCSTFISIALSISSALVLVQGAAATCPHWDKPQIILSRAIDMKKWKPELLYPDTSDVEMHTYYTKPDNTKVNTHFHLAGERKDIVDIHVITGVNDLYMETHLINDLNDVKEYHIPARSQCVVAFYGSDVSHISYYNL